MAAKMSPPLNGIFLHEENDTLVSSPVNIEPCLYDDLNSPADQICGAEVQRYDPSNSNEFQTILDNKTCAQTEAEPQSTKGLMASSDRVKSNVEVSSINNQHRYGGGPNSSLNCSAAVSLNCNPSSSLTKSSIDSEWFSSLVQNGEFGNAPKIPTVVPKILKTTNSNYDEDFSIFSDDFGKTPPITPPKKEDEVEDVTVSAAMITINEQAALVQTKQLPFYLSPTISSSSFPVHHLSSSNKHNDEDDDAMIISEEEPETEEESPHRQSYVNASIKSPVVLTPKSVQESRPVLKGSKEETLPPSSLRTPVNDMLSNLNHAPELIMDLKPIDSDMFLSEGKDVMRKADSAEHMMEDSTVDFSKSIEDFLTIEDPSPVLSENGSIECSDILMSDEGDGPTLKLVETSTAEAQEQTQAIEGIKGVGCSISLSLQFKISQVVRKALNKPKEELSKMTIGPLITQIAVKFRREMSTVFRKHQTIFMDCIARAIKDVFIEKMTPEVCVMCAKEKTLMGKKKPYQRKSRRVIKPSISVSRGLLRRLGRQGGLKIASWDLAFMPMSSSLYSSTKKTMPPPKANIAIKKKTSMKQPPPPPHSTSTIKQEELPPRRPNARGQQKGNTTMASKPLVSIVEEVDLVATHTSLLRPTPPIRNSNVPMKMELDESPTSDQVKASTKRKQEESAVTTKNAEIEQVSPKKRRGRPPKVKSEPLDVQKEKEAEEEVIDVEDEKNVSPRDACRLALPKLLAALPIDIRDRCMEIFWVKFDSKVNVWWPGIVHHTNGVSDAMQARFEKCSTTKHLVYFYGSGDWGFIDFKNVRPFKNKNPPDELTNPMFFKGSKKNALVPRPLTANRKAQLKKGIQIAVAELKIKDKWDRLEWLEDSDSSDSSSSEEEEEEDE